MDKKSKMRELVSRISEIERLQKFRAEHDKLGKYNKAKVHKKQMEFHKCPKRNRWVFGGNRSGKTECGAVEAVWWARGIHPYRENRKDVCGWVVSPTYEVQREVSQSKILSYLRPEWIVDVTMQSGRKSSPEGGVIDYITIKNALGGVSRIGFKSADQGRERFQGASLDFVWFDEEPPQDVYQECLMRVMDRKGEIWGTMTPLKGRTWVFDEIYRNIRANPEVWSITMEWADNPYLDPEEIKLLTNAFDKESVESRRYGRFGEEGGLVYPEFDESVHVVDPFPVPPEWYDNISIDPGLHNPLSCHFYAVDYDGNVYVIAEHYESGKDIDYHAKRIKEIADGLKWHRDAKGRLKCIIDSAASQRTLSSLKSVSDLFYEKDILCDTSVDKDLWSGIAQVKSYLKERPPRIVIFRNCVNMIREIKGYYWGKGDAPIKADDHAMDELRYYLMSKPRPHPVKKEGESIQQKYKNKLIRLGRRR
ncbi:MAG TPA: hypothetical protein DIC18_01450 [Clostridiales bacterium]|nr:hypothetical protein [Clostridiales bacterium]